MDEFGKMMRIIYLATIVLLIALMFRKPIANKAMEKITEISQGTSVVKEAESLEEPGESAQEAASSAEAANAGRTE